MAYVISSNLQGASGVTNQNSRQIANMFGGTINPAYIYNWKGNILDIGNTLAHERFAHAFPNALNRLTQMDVLNNHEPENHKNKGIEQAGDALEKDWLRNKGITVYPNKLREMEKISSTTRIYIQMLNLLLSK